MNSGNTGDPSGFVLAELLTCCSQQDRLVRGMRGMLRLWTGSTAAAFGTGCGHMGAALWLCLCPASAARGAGRGAG